MHEARYYTRQADGSVRCGLCPHACHIQPGRRGICKVRENQAGRLVALAYARAIAVQHDPIEKKPLFHVLPGSISTSVATAGCNLRCDHCQNFEISQLPVRDGTIGGLALGPEAVVGEALGVGAATISFTYTEPTIFMEWAQDIAAAAAARGLGCVSVTNGFTSAQPLRDLAAAGLLAANVDLKSFDDGFYQKVCGARLEPVLETIGLLRGLGVWVEVTTLLIPGLNDEPAQLEALAGFLASVDPAMPWHLSRFHPDHKMHDRGPTPLASIQQACRIGQAAGLRFVYSGNVWGDEGEHTRCPACAAVLIERRGFSVLANRLSAGACPDCGEKIEGVWA
jgi:pyruvate formate lyase activating enzyme